MNSKVASHFLYNWWAYLAIFLVAVLLWSYVFSILASPKDNEKVAITFVGSDFYSNKLQEHLIVNCTVITAQPLRKITVEYLVEDDGNLQAIIDDRTHYNDLVILTESMLSQNGGTINMHTYARRIPMDKLRQILGGKVDDLEFFLVSYEDYTDMEFGIYLNDPNDGVTTRFEQFYTGNERCVVFFAFNSPNLLQLYDVGNATDGCAIDFLLYIMEAV